MRKYGIHVVSLHILLLLTENKPILRLVGGKATLYISGVSLTPGHVFGLQCLMTSMTTVQHRLQHNTIVQ